MRAILKYAALLAVGFVLGWLARTQLVETDVALFNQVRRGLPENHLYDLPDSRELTYAAITGMVERIDDPFAAFIEPGLAARFEADFTGGAGIIGLFPEKIDGVWVVSAVLPDSPSEAAGLRAGDRLVSVDGFPFDAHMTNGAATLALRGPIGEAAQVVVERDGQLLTFAPLREARPVILDARMVNGRIALLAQHTFTANAPEEVQAALQTLLAQNPAALIWDLRSNGGGSMEAAQAVLSQFIGDGVLFRAELHGGELQEFEAQGEGLARDLPVVVLIGERTYSAAETAAIVMAERGRAVLIGSVTYGKGTIQTTVPLVDGSLLQFTIARWLSPDGTWVQGTGVLPDIEVYDDPDTAVDEVVEAAVTYLEANVLP
ncbi:MAG: PDZ domain-containing protein [Anaerolineales bacterium]|nr:PDZ domain-containing protein [Anaerolineales bacterium]